MSRWIILYKYKSSSMWQVTFDPFCVWETFASREEAEKFWNEKEKTDQRELVAIYELI